MTAGCGSDVGGRGAAGGPCDYVVGSAGLDRSFDTVEPAPTRLAGSARDRSFGWTSFFARLSRECFSSEGVVSELAGGTELAQSNIAMITAPIASTPLNASFAPVATRSMTPLTSVSPALNDTDDDARASALGNRRLR